MKKLILKIRFKIDKNILKLLIFFTFDKEKLKQIQSEINNWKYPSLFKSFEPKYYSSLHHFFIKNNEEHQKLKLKDNMCKFDFSTPSRKILQKRITHKEFLEYGFKRRGELDMFESWYKVEYPNGSKY